MSVTRFTEKIGTCKKAKKIGGIALKVFDRREALARLSDDAKILDEILTLFHQHHEEMLTDLRQAFKKKNCENIRASAHSIKGALANVSAKVAWKTATLLEQSARENDLEKAGQLMHRLEKHIAKFISVTSNYLVEG